MNKPLLTLVVVGIVLLLCDFKYTAWAMAARPKMHYAYTTCDTIQEVNNYCVNPCWRLHSTFSCGYRPENKEYILEEQVP